MLKERGYMVISILMIKSLLWDGVSELVAKGNILDTNIDFIYTVCVGGRKTYRY